MNKTLLVLISTLLAGTAFAADKAASTPGSKQPTARQMKMVTCGKLSKGMKGDEHKAFMKDCMSKKEERKPAAAASASASASAPAPAAAPAAAPASAPAKM